MQKLKKKSGLLFVILIFSSCGSLPKKPQIELCAHHLETSTAQCYDNQTGKYSEYSIKKTENWVMMKPEDWGLILLYIKKLSQRSPKKIKNELNKVRKTSNKLEARLLKSERRLKGYNEKYYIYNPSLFSER